MKGECRQQADDAMRHARAGDGKRVLLSELMVRRDVDASSHAEKVAGLEERAHRGTAHTEPLKVAASQYATAAHADRQGWRLTGGHAGDHTIRLYLYLIYDDLFLINIEKRWFTHTRPPDAEALGGVECGRWSRPAWSAE